MKTLATGLLIAIIACGGCRDAAAPPPPVIDPTLTLSAPPSVAQGGSLKATAVLTPSGAVTWFSDRSDVATVSDAGVITGVAPGEATIRVSGGALTKLASIEVVEPFADVALGERNACARTMSGADYCWGADIGPQTCHPHGFDARCSTTPIRSPGTESLARVAVDTCGLTPNGEAECWGDSRWAGSGGLAPGGIRFASLGTGREFACGLDAGGQAYCWGMNFAHNLGSPASSTCGTYSCLREPTAVMGGHTFTSISVGALHACGVTSAGKAYCWGLNANGQLGNGSITTGGDNTTGLGGETTPVQVVSSESFAFINAGVDHTCALTTAGQAYCWGANDGGQLGNGVVSTRSLVPVPVAGGVEFTSITAGGGHTCALTGAGAAYCWGHNGETGGDAGGMVGDGTYILRTAPVPVARSFAFVQLHAKGNFTCGRVATGHVYCWGSNLYGQLGAGSIALLRSNVPIGVGGVP